MCIVLHCGAHLKPLLCFLPLSVLARWLLCCVDALLWRSLLGRQFDAADQEDLPTLAEDLLFAVRRRSLNQSQGSTLTSAFIG